MATTKKTRRRQKDRLESNGEILETAQRTAGHVRIRVQFQIFDFKASQYVGFRGKALVFSVRNPRTAAEIVDGAKSLFLKWRPE